jgi:hypothetical protein
MNTRILSILVFLLTTAVRLEAQDKITLREQLRPGETAVVSLEFKAQGDLLIPQGNNKETAQKLTAQGKLAYEEKCLPVEADSKGVSSKSLRYYTSSSVESVVESTRIAREVREPVRVMVCEVRNGRPFVFSPSGPLTVDEYELVEADATLDSLVLGGLLPTEPVAIGDTWSLSDAAVAAVLNFAHVTENKLGAKLETFDDSSAKISLTGHVSGIASGAKSTRTVVAQVLFDRARSKITQLDLSHNEEREMGPLGHALRVKATYNFRRNTDGEIARLNDTALEKLPLASNPATEQLVYAQPDGKFRFHFQRGWFVTLSNPQAAVMRLVEQGAFVSECHVLAAPAVAAGTHMKPEEFRAQVQQALGKQFQQFTQEGEVPAPKGYWIYRLAAAGVVGQQPVVWNYHLVAGPQGQQIVFIFRLPADQIDQFGVKDLAVVATIEFEAPRTVSNQK